MFKPLSRLLLPLLLLLAPVATEAQVIAPAAKPGVHYLRWMDPAHLQTYEAANFPVKGGSTLGSLDIEWMTHEGKDGTIIPDSWQNWIRPVDWALTAGCGGGSKLKCGPGFAVNLLPSVVTFALGRAGSSSSPGVEAFKQAATAGLAMPGGTTLGCAIGYKLMPGVIDDGHFQNFRAMFPEQGFLPNIAAASYISASSSLRFGGPKL
ncbi:MAG: hypothetical protein NTY77_05725 [Elusimicrobia bacterium]|nr:hypothetical protein [Elusimicrobiota bacterium]